MMIWDNILIADPPMLKRSTHAYCSYCGTNLEAYRQETCNACLLPLNDDKEMVVYGASLTDGIGFVKRARLGVQSLLLRIRARARRGMVL
jgi:predicted amidophosphoribosyltransferase